MLFVFAFFIPSLSAGETTISVTAKTENPSHSGNRGLSFKFVFYWIKLYHAFQGFMTSEWLPPKVKPLVPGSLTIQHYLTCDYSNVSYWAVLSWSAVCYNERGDCNFRSLHMKKLICDHPHESYPAELMILYKYHLHSVQIWSTSSNLMSVSESRSPKRILIGFYPVLP